MRTYVRVLASTGVVLALGICLLSLIGPGYADEKAAAAEILKVANAIEGGNAAAVAKGVAATKSMELLDIMTAFKKRDATPPGLGFGPKPGAYNPDGIEAQIMGLARKELLAAAATKQKDDIAKAAYVSEAIAEMTFGKGPNKKMGDKDPNDWKKWTQDMKDASKGLAEAAKKGDPKSIKDAANKLNASCNNCHGVFRD